MQKRPCRGSVAKEALGASLRLPSLALSTQSLCLPGPAVSAAVALLVRKRRDAGHPEAQAQDVAESSVLHVVTDWTTAPEFGHEDERTWAARRLLC